MTKQKLIHLSMVVVLLLASGPGVWGASAAAASSRVTFSGRVLDVSDQPIEGAEVGLHEMTGSVTSPAGYEIKLLESVTTGSDGAFSFELDAAETYRQAMIVARRQGLALGWGYWTMRADQQQDIRLTEPASISGVVVDTEGRPLADASVFVAAGRIGTGPDDERYLLGPLSRRLLSTQTNASGHFVLAGLSADAKLELGVQKSGYATMTTIDRSSPGDDAWFVPGQADVRLVLESEARIEGRVVRQDGTPLEDVPVAIRGERMVPYLLPKPARPQSDGMFRFDGLLADTYTIGLAVPEQDLAEWVATPIRVTLEVGQVKTDVPVEAGKGGLVEFAVTDAASGQPIEEARVGTRRVQDGNWFHAVTDERGIARLRLSPGSYQYTGASKTGYARDPEGRPLAVTEGQTQRVSLPLKAAPKLSGTIRDPEGRPVAGAAVSVLPAGRDEVISDANGHYETNWDPSIWGPQETTFCLLTRHAERNLAAAVEMTIDTQSLDVTLQPGVTLSGKIVGSDGRNLAGARVTASLRMSNWGASTSREGVHSEADGTFVISALPRDQRYSIHAVTDGYGSMSHDVEAEVTQAKQSDVGTLVLPIANLSVSGQVVDVDGNPVAGARLSSSGWDGQSSAHATADSKGRFVVEGVCAGQVDLRVHGVRSGQAVSGRMRAEGGAIGVRIVVREGRSPIQYHSSKTYDQIVASSERVIAGVAVDESGAPVAGVPVGVCCHKIIRENGRMGWHYASFPTLRATTDAQGRFAIALEDDGEYNLLFSPDRLAATIVYDLPVNTKGLKVTLETGGTLTGRLLRLDSGRKVPIPNAEVKFEQTDRAAYTHLGFDRDRTTLTDDQGYFRIEHIQTGVRPMTSRADAQWSPIPRVWQLVYEGTTQTLAFIDGNTIEGFELLIKPDIDATGPLTGHPLPAFEGIAIGFGEDQARGKPILICFFDFQQRPSRNTVMQLIGQAESLAQKGVIVLAVQATDVDRSSLDTWARDNSVPFPVGIVTGDIEATRAIWRVQSLPWLILTDGNHVVVAEGFGLDELDEIVRNDSAR